MKFGVTAGVAGLWLAGFAGQVVAQDVTLTSRDKSIEISGNLLGFDGDYYRVETVYGELTVDSTGVLCEGPACPNLESYVAHLTFSGSRQIGRVLLPALIEGYARQANLIAVREEKGADSLRYWIQSADGAETAGLFDIRLTSSSEGFADVLSNEADIAMSLREATGDEIALTEEIGLGRLTKNRQQIFLGFDSVSVIVPDASPLDQIGLDEVAGLISGGITSWAGLGVDEDAPVQVVGFEGLPEVWGQVQQEIAGFGYALDGEIGELPLGGDAENLLSVPFGFHSQVPERMRALAFRANCGMVYEPDELALRSGELPFRFPLILYRPMRRLPEIGQEFLDFVKSPSGQRVVARAGYVPATPRLYDFEAIGYRIVNGILLSETPEDFTALKETVAALKAGQLVGGGLRVGENGRLTAGSLSLIAHVVQMVELGQIDGKQILFAGFGPDSDLARQAMEMFTDALSDGSYNVSTEARHFGELLPLACPDTDAGIALNARIEIWLRQPDPR